MLTFSVMLRDQVTGQRYPVLVRATDSDAAIAQAFRLMAHLRRPLIWQTCEVQRDSDPWARNDCKDTRPLAEDVADAWRAACARMQSGEPWDRIGRCAPPR